MPDPRDEGLSRDGFLGGQLTILQPKSGYRAGIDPVLLAASVPALAGQSVLDLGTGVGTAALCLGWRVPELRLIGLERQGDYAALARRNAADNASPLTVVEGDIADLPPEIRRESFDHVLMNPPFWDRAKRTGATDPGREDGLAEETPLALWCDIAIRRLKPGGRLAVLHAAERLPDLLAGLDARLGDVTVLPIQPRDGRSARRVIVQARKGARGAFRLLPPLILHQGAHHERDAESFTPDVAAILRDGAPLPFPNR